MKPEETAEMPKLYFLGPPTPAIHAACEVLPYAKTIYSNINDFLAQVNFEQVGCLVTGLKLPVPESPPAIGSSRFDSAIAMTQELHALNQAIQVLLVIDDVPPDSLRDLYHSSIYDVITPAMPQGLIVEVLKAALIRSVNASKMASEEAQFRERIGALTDREVDVVKHLCHGRQLKEISAALSVSVQTASKHRSRIFRKLRVTNEVELFRNYGDFLAGKEEELVEEREQSRAPNFLERSKLHAEDRR